MAFIPHPHLPCASLSDLEAAAHPQLTWPCRCSPLGLEGSSSLSLSALGGLPCTPPTTPASSFSFLPLYFSPLDIVSVCSTQQSTDLCLSRSLLDPQHLGQSLAGVGTQYILAE